MSASVLNITVAVFLVVIAAGPLPWSSYAAFCKLFAPVMFREYSTS